MKCTYKLLGPRSASDQKNSLEFSDHVKKKLKVYRFYEVTFFPYLSVSDYEHSKKVPFTGTGVRRSSRFTLCVIFVDRKR